jgi:arylsulfatase A-like enzyme
MPERPNVIILVSDTFRPDHLSINGQGHAETPELDAFIRSSITFDGATVSSFPTIPMRTDWFTGRFSHLRHGWQDLEPQAITLPDVLRSAGYTTQLLGDNTHMLRSKFWRPFHYFHFLRGHEGDAAMCRLNDPVRRVVADLRKTRMDFGNMGDRPTLCDLHAHTNFRQRYEEDAHCSLLADSACRWIEDNYRGGPFLLWVDFFDVHEPWFPPEYLLRKYQPRYDGEPMPHPNYHSAEVYAPEELANLRARYAAMCTLLSKSAGRVLRLIEDTGLRENSVVVFLSDHGIYLGEHGLTGKSLIRPDAFDIFPFHPEIARLCWSISVPPSLPLSAARPGTRLPQLIQAPDLMPTLLDLCGIRAPAEAKIEGKSLVPLLRGETQDSPRPISVTASTTGTNHAPGLLHCRRPAVTDGEWTLILREPPDPAPPLLFHTRQDPAHRRDLFREQRSEAERLHAAMLDFLRAYPAPQAALDRLAAGNCGLA